MAALIAYYSRAGENYFGGAYRRIAVGNTEKAANMLALNAGAGIYVSGLTNDYKQGVALAHDIIYGGQALEKMSVLSEFTKTLKEYEA